MDNNDTKVGSGIVVPLYTASSAVRNSPHQIQGTLLTFADRQYLAGVGKFRTEIPLGMRFIVLETRAGWRRWEGGRIVEFVTEINGRYPMRHELGHTDERVWGPGPGGKPADPWQDAREALLLREIDLAEHTFATSSGGGRAAIDSLARSMQNANRLRPGQFPIVELAWRPMNTAFGTKSKPDLKIVGWWRPEQTTIAPPDNDLNDAIPDLSK
jgi:hypothetical protein